MSSGSPSGFEARAHEISHSQSTPALAHASSAHDGSIFSGTSSEPMELLCRTKSEHDVTQTRQSFRRLRRQPIDPSLEQASTKPDEVLLARGPPRWCRFVYNSEEVFRKVLPRTEGNIKFPEYDAAGSYARSDDVVLKMWHDETLRLVRIANSPGIPLEFKSNGFLQGDTKNGYSGVSKLSQKILTANAICLLDNECLNAEHRGSLSNQQKIASLIEQVTKSQRVAVTTAGLEDSRAQQESLHSLAASYSLINYISAVLVNLITQTIRQRYWHINFINILIRRIAKIKLLLRDLQTSSAIAVRAGQAVLSTLRESGSTQHSGSEIDEEEDLEEYMRMVETKEKEGVVSYEEKQIASYYIEQNKLRFGLNTALRDFLMSMRFTTRSSLPASAWEISVLTYSAHHEGFMGLLYQSRDLEYSATSDLHNLNTAYSAFNTLNRTIDRLDRSHNRSKCAGGVGINLRYPSRDSFDSGSKVLRLDSMDEVITVLVPLTATNPAFLANLTSLRHAIALDAQGRVTREEVLSELSDDATRYRCTFFCLYTSQIDVIVDRRQFDARRRGVFLLSQAFEADVFSPYEPWKPQGMPVEQLNKLMDGWVIDEMSVTVPCPRYVWSVIAGASLLAVGGLGIGFSVGERIHGVDPSNLATYLWVVAAFIVLIAKNMQVKEWAWNDFLRRRVRCCSVSELTFMTGMDGQLIISKLLHDERRGSVLNIRGPYNSAFLRRANQGFSIDEPISLSTLLNSGLVMLKVTTSKGNALVCLDFRRGTNLSAIGHTPDPEKEYLIYEDVDNFQVGAYWDSEDPRFPDKHEFSRSRGLKWKRVQGIYYVEEAKFV